MPAASRHQIDWVASGLRRAASDAGVILPVDYSRTVAADGLSREPGLGVTRLGVGVVIHTTPEGTRRLPLVLGYADARGQWYRDGRRHRAEPDPPATDSHTREVAM
jgi:hypothetical protein